MMGLCTIKKFHLLSSWAEVGKAIDYCRGNGGNEPFCKYMGKCKRCVNALGYIILSQIIGVFCLALSGLTRLLAEIFLNLFPIIL